MPDESGNYGMSFRFVAERPVQMRDELRNYKQICLGWVQLCLKSSSQSLRAFFTSRGFAQ